MSIKEWIEEMKIHYEERKEEKEFAHELKKQMERENK